MRSTLFSMLASLNPRSLAPRQTQQTPDLTALLKSNSNLSEFATLLTSYGDIYANLSFQQDITILAPSNAAFQKIPYSSLGAAFEANNSDIVRSVLQYHVLEGIHAAGSFNGSFTFIPTWLNNQTYTNTTGGQVVAAVQQAGNVNVFVTGLGSRSTLTTPDLAFTGGLVQVVDTFLVPPVDYIQTVPQFNLTALGGATTNASLNRYLDTTPDITIFAPNNNAFQELGSTLSTMSASDLMSLLDYHVVNGSNFVGYSANLPNGTILQSLQGGNLSISFADNSIFVNSARVIQEDLLIANGVLHVIDNVLDYNATGVKPNPVIPTQVAIVPGSSLSGNVVPYTSDLPSTLTSFATTSPTGAAASSSFGVSDIGNSAAASSTISGAAASTTDGGASTTSKKKSAGDKIESQGSLLGGAIGIVIWAIGFL